MFRAQPGGDTWFYEPPTGDAEHSAPTPLRPLDELIFTYHSTVGHNTVLELDFAIDRNGLVAPSHAALYKRLGDFIRDCYSTPIGIATTPQGDTSASATVALGSALEFDRVVLEEDQTQGQRVRGWVVEWSSDNGVTWKEFETGASVGAKRIVIFPSAMSYTATHVRLNITRTYGPAPRVTLGVYSPCMTGTIDTITKLGTEDIGMTETTPFVFKGELYRFESLRSGNWNNTLNCSNTSPGQGRSCVQYLRVRRQSGPPAWKTGDVVTPPFGEGYGLGCAFVDQGDTVYAYASREKQDVAVYSATDLAIDAPWSSGTALTLPNGYTVFNTAVHRGVLDNVPTYAMAIEVRHAALGGGFNLVFATAPTALGPWTLKQSLPVTKGLMFGPGSCPALRYDAASGYWHMLYTPNPTVAGGDYRTWQIYAARSKTLAEGSWESSPLNPVMVADAHDRKIHNTDIPTTQQGWATNTSNLNDSDPDLVEYDGQVLFVGNWGDQKTTPTNSLYLATYNGTLVEFWASLYPSYT